jgi:hypothetical protein
MPEIQNNFTQGKMNKDLDERIVPLGQYRDALNIEVSTSEGSDIGAVQNILGNTQKGYLEQPYPLPTIQATTGNTNALPPSTVEVDSVSICVGSVSDEKNDKLYYLVHNGIDTQPPCTIENNILANGPGVSGTAFYNSNATTPQPWLYSNGIGSYVDAVMEYSSINSELVTVFRNKHSVVIDIYHAESGVDRNFGTYGTSPPTGFNSRGFEGFYQQNSIAVACEEDSLKVGSLAHCLSVNSNGDIIDLFSYDGIERRIINIKEVGQVSTLPNIKKYVIALSNEFSWVDANGVQIVDAIHPSFFVFSDDSACRFRKDNLITGINTLDNMLFWTDNYSEPKKINISRCIKGTDQNTNDPTKLVVLDQIVQPTVEMKEKDITLIKKAPKLPPTLEMQTSRSGNSWGWLDLNFSITNFEVGDTFTVDIQPFQASSGPLNYKVGDHLFLKAPATTGMYPITADDYDIRLLILSVAPGAYMCRVVKRPYTYDNTHSYGVSLDESTDHLFKLKFPKFALRYKYEDGEYSSFGPFSDLAFVPGEYDFHPKKGYNLGMENRLKELTLKNIVPNDIPKDVVQVDILYKETGSTNIYIVEQIKTTDDEWEDNEYKVENETIFSVLPENQTLRPWDNVPRKALAQEVIANRIVFANYLQSYDLIDVTKKYIKPNFNIFLQEHNYSKESIKSLRTYQLGIIYLDEYGRETPIQTSSKASIKTSHLDANKVNKITTSVNNLPPDFAKYYKFYIKETSDEYYNLVMDRYFDAEDGNVWISFTSHDRNKLTIDDTLILKKSLEGGAVEEKNSFKILDIKNEAPKFIKTRRAILGEISQQLQNWVRTITTTSNQNSYDFWPLVGKKEFHMLAVSMQNGALHNWDDKLPANGGDLSAPLWVRFISKDYTGTVADATWGDELQYRTKWYEIDNAKKDESDQLYIVRLKEELGADAEWMNTGTPINPVLSVSATNGDIEVQIAQDYELNKSRFQGRFFVKVEFNDLFRSTIAKPQEKFGLKIVEKNLYYAKDFQQQDPCAGATSGGINPVSIDKTAHETKINLFNIDGPVLHQCHDPIPNWANPTGYTQPFSGYQNTNSDLSQLLTFWSPGINGLLPTGIDIPNTSYYSKHVWLKIYNALNSAPEPSNWFIDEAFAVAEEPWWATGAVYDNWAQNQNGNSTFMGWNYYSAFVGRFGNQTNDHNANDFVTFNGLTISGLNLGSVGTIPAGVSGSDAENYQYFSEGKGIEDNQIDISYIGPNWDLENVPWTSTTSGPSSTILGMAPPYTALWKIQDNNNQSPDIDGDELFATMLQQPGRTFVFTNDPKRDVYTIVKTEVFYKRNYANYNFDDTYPFATEQYGYPDPNPPQGQPQNQTGDAKLRMYTENYRAYNFRITFRLTLDKTIGFNNYTPLTSGSAPNNNGVVTSWTAPTLNTNPCGMEFIDLYELDDGYSNTGEALFPEDPAVWETEPKEMPELDIYYEASEALPIEINDDTNVSFADIGSLVEVALPGTLVSMTLPTAITPGAFPTMQPVKIVSWDNDTITIDNYVALSVIQGNLLKFIRPNGSFVTARIHGLTGNIQTAAGTTWSKSIRLITSVHDSTHGLSWSNCFSFKNGVESDRIRDIFNEKQLDNGVKASTTIEDKTLEERRGSGLIYSGVYNSTSGINNLNQFIQAEKITKDLNPIYGTIQKLHTRETNLVTLCEDKSLRIMADKNAVFNADGNPQLVATENVLGQTIPFIGNYGISKNPESFASDAYRGYYTDKQRGAIIRLSMDGITNIAEYGMSDYFKDNLKEATKLMGSFDSYKDEYNLTLNNTVDNAPKTVSFSEKVKGFTSFKSFIKEDGLSMAGNYYTFKNGSIYKHHDNETRNNFYGEQYESSVDVLLSNEPNIRKSFKTLNYDGSQSRVAATTSIPGTTVTLGPNIALDPTFDLSSPSSQWTTSMSPSGSTMTVNNIGGQLVVEDMNSYSWVPDNLSYWITNPWTPSLTPGAVYDIQFDFEYTTGTKPVFGILQGGILVNPNGIPITTPASPWGTAMPGVPTTYTFQFVPNNPGTNVQMGFLHNGFMTGSVIPGSFKIDNLSIKENMFLDEFPEGTYHNLIPKCGWWVDSIITDLQRGTVKEFIEKENKWFNYIKGEAINSDNTNIDTSDFSFQGLGTPNSITGSIGTNTITLQFNSINDSLQVGDTLYYTNLSQLGGFNVGSNPIILGVVNTIIDNTIEITPDSSIVLSPLSVSTNDFIMFSKNRVINASNLLGYYARINLKNDCIDKAELFTIASEVFESSK